MNAVATTTQVPSVINDMAARFGMDRRAFEATLKATIMPASTSDEQVVAFLLVAKKYDLNPFTKEIFAFPSRGGIQPIVSIDGWLKIINSHPQFDGMEFDDKLDDKGNLVAITCRIFRKDHTRAVEVTEYMAECKGTTDVWKRWPSRMLRHKAAIQAGRYAFGFSGIVDPDEAERIDSTYIETANVLVQPKTLRAAVIHEQVAHVVDSALEEASMFTTQEVHDAIVSAKDRDSLDTAFDLVRTLPTSEHAALTDVYNKRALEIVDSE